VLVLDDEALITLDLEVALCESGFTVAVAASCDEATRFLQDQTPDAAILDVRLREGECVGVAETLVARDVPFVVLTGTHEVDLHGAFRAGKLVPKPADAHGIVALVRSMVSGSHPN
jgi:DNA-binding response OmpR family regulator